MSREINFRIWDGKRYWYNVAPLNNAEALTQELTDGECEWEYNNQYAVRKGIIEQYTGIKDKNGKEIYEVDILETCCGKAEVYFDDELLMYKIKVRHGGTMPLVSKKSKRHFDYEIIGNIHESLELVGGEE